MKIVWNGAHQIWTVNGAVGEWRVRYKPYEAWWISWHASVHNWRDNVGWFTAELRSNAC